MRISDMLRQYNRNVSNGTEELRSVQGTQKLVSTVGELAAGRCIEGTVDATRGRVRHWRWKRAGDHRTSGWKSGYPAEPQCFQVKENDGQTVGSVQHVQSTSGQPDASRRADSCASTVIDRALAMTDAVIQEGMPINRENLLAMIKYVNANPDANVADDSADGEAGTSGERDHGGAV